MSDERLVQLRRRAERAPTRRHIVATLFVSVTKRCNLSCAYCSADAGPDRRETLALTAALARVDQWLGTSGASKHHLIFSGGEPTAWGYDRLDAVCERARARAAELGVRVRLGIQTNGTTIGERFVAWCRRWEVEPSISLDGPPYLSDECRGEGDRVLRGIARLQREGISFAVIVCLSRAIVSNMAEVLEFFRVRGITKVRFNALGEAPPGRESDRLTADELLAAKTAIYLHRMRWGASAVRELNVGRQIEWFDASVRGQPVVHGHCARLECGAGREIAAVNPDGEVAACIERSMTGGMPVVPSFGELAATMDAYWNGFSGWPRCDECEARGICDHGCPVYHRLAHDRFDAECEANRAFFRFLVDDRASTILMHGKASAP